MLKMIGLFTTKLCRVMTFFVSLSVVSNVAAATGVDSYGASIGLRMGLSPMDSRVAPLEFPQNQGQPRQDAIFARGARTHQIFVIDQNHELHISLYLSELPYPQNSTDEYELTINIDDLNLNNSSGMPKRIFFTKIQFKKLATDGFQMRVPVKLDTNDSRETKTIDVSFKLIQQ